MNNNLKPDTNKEFNPVLERKVRRQKKKRENRMDQNISKTMKVTKKP